jgi:hypothetical protein
MLKAVRAFMFVLLLTCSTQAGEMPNGSPQPPPPPQPTSVIEEEAPTEGETSNDLTDTLTEAALSVLNNVLALL